MSRSMEAILRDALAQGLLDAATARPLETERHWSLLLFTAVAAWLCAIPVMGVVLLLSFGVFERSSGLLVGIPLMAGSVMLLRQRSRSLFLEQLAMPGLLAGAALFAYQAESWTGSLSVGLGLLVPVACAVAVLVGQVWVRVLAGVAIAASAAAALSASHGWRLSDWDGLPWLAVVGAWVALHAVQRSIVLNGGSARLVAGIEAVSSGMAVVALAGMVWASGRTFLVSELLGDIRPDGAGLAGAALARGLSALLAVAGAALLAWRWPPLRTWWYGLLALSCAVLAWFAPLLGAVLLMLGACAGSGRYGLASFAGFAAAWMVGGLYYAVAWPLAAKALVLLGVGAVAALLGRFAVRAPQPPADLVPELQPALQPELQPAPHAVPLPAPSRLRIRAGALLCGALVLMLANVAIWQKEALIGSGATVFVELAPVDPRSLMQGDYMRLNFALPGERPPVPVAPGARARVVAQKDARGVATLLRFDDGGPLGADEFPIEVLVKNGGWALVTDAWYFKEGEAQRWETARYGEFRIGRDGKALLVGLRGAALDKL